MFGGMGKNFWGLRVSFFMDWKVASENLHQVSLFHPTLLLCRRHLTRASIQLRLFNNRRKMPEMTGEKTWRKGITSFYFPRCCYKWFNNQPITLLLSNAKRVTITTIFQWNKKNQHYRFEYLPRYYQNPQSRNEWGWFSWP